MGDIKFNPLQNTVSRAAKFLKDTFGNNGSGSNPYGITQQQQNITPSDIYGSGANNNPYQIQNGDTFDSIAKKYNTTPQALQQANGLTVPPPKGHMITIPHAPASVYTRPNTQTTVIPAVGYDPAMRGRSYGTYMASQTNNMGGAINYGANLNEYAASVNTQFASGTLPQTIPQQLTGKLINPQTGQPFQDADYIAEGYVYNNQMQQWELPGANNQQTAAAALTAPGAQSNNNWATNPSLRLVTVNKYAHNWNNRYVTTLKHLQTMQQHKKQSAKGARPGKQAKPEAVYGAGTSPMTTLDLNLGGG